MARLFRERDGAARRAQQILRTQARMALHSLDADGRANDEDIHEARKRIKEARATLRLVRAALLRPDYRRQDRALRTAAQSLSAARDARILVAALDRLDAQYRSARDISGAEGFHRELVRQRTQARHEVTSGGIRCARRRLREARLRAARWSLGRRSGWRDIVRGAEHSYIRGREALAQVRREAGVAGLHAWRKQAKYLYLQLEELAPVCGPAVSRMARELHALSDDLGDDHDLAMLRTRVAEHAQHFADEASAAALVTLIERARNRLQKRALLRGERLYRPVPEQFARLLETRHARGARR
jgi:CHAD domain-containing protein